MNVDNALSQLRPILSLAGSVLIAAGFLEFWDIVSLPKDGIYVAASGWFLKQI